MHADYKTAIIFVVVHRPCHGNQWILGDFCQRWNWLFSLFALVFWNEIHYRLADARINSYTISIAVDRVKKMVKIGSVVFELNWGRIWKLCFDSAEIGRYSFIWHIDVLKRIGIWQFWFQHVNRQSFLYKYWKFGEIWISDPGVLGERSCTDGVDNCYHA